MRTLYRTNEMIKKQSGKKDEESSVLNSAHDVLDNLHLVVGRGEHDPDDRMVQYLDNIETFKTAKYEKDLFGILFEDAHRRS